VETLEVLIPFLLVAVAALSVLASAIGIPYPILLVIGGLALGFVPGLPEVELEPDLVLVLFLPPLLYVSAFFTSLRDLRYDLRGISLLAVGLVVATMCAVAVIARATTGMPWAVAFALGAIVSPTDAIAATAVARRVGAPRRVVTVLEGESLLNDASALVAYRFAVGAATGSGFVLWEAGLKFLLGAVGGIAIGLAVGWVVRQLRRRIDDPPAEVAISLFTGYAAFLPAEQLDLSGVLAAVTAGIYLGWYATELTTASTRIQITAVWEIVSFLLNATLFVLIGFQLQVVLEAIEGRSAGELLGLGALVSLTVIVTRYVWFFTIPYVLRVVDRRESQVERRGPARLRIVLGWAGLRGAVSLAAALALPVGFPERDLILFLTFAVILATLVLQGLSLPVLIRALGVEDDGGEEREELAARVAAADAALARLDELAQEEWTRDDTVERMRGLYGFRRRRFESRQVGDAALDERSSAYQRMVREVLAAQRAALLRLRNERVISDEVMRRVEREIDLEDTRLEI
jgi:Na+/H+ antiporter